MLFKPVESFDFLKPQTRKQWQQRIAATLDKESKVIPVNRLIYSMSLEAESIFSQFVFPDDQVQRYDAVMQKFNEYCVPQINIVHEGYLFNQRIQRADKNVAAYVRALLYEVAERANYHNKDEAIRDQLVLVVMDEELYF